MVTKKTNDDNLPPLFLDKEDRESFARQRQGKGAQSGRTLASSVEKKQVNQGSGGRSIAWFALLVALSGYGGSYFLHEQLTMRSNELQSATSRIEELERQLSITGEELGESSGTLQAQLAKLNGRADTLWTEMDKLWASAWRKNQTQIKKLQTVNGALDKKLVSVTKVADNTKKNLWKVISDVDKNTTSQATILAKAEDNQARITATNDNLVGIEVALQSMDESTLMARQDAQKRDTAIAALAEQLRDLREQNKQLKKQVQALNDWRQNSSAISSEVPVSNAG